MRDLRTSAARRYVHIADMYTKPTYEQREEVNMW